MPFPTEPPAGIPQQVWDHLVEMFGGEPDSKDRRMIAYAYALGLTHGRNEHLEDEDGWSPGQSFRGLPPRTLPPTAR